jgi:hypothetical protein
LIIEISEKVINSLFRDIDYEEDNRIEIQLAAELKTNIFNEIITTTRNDRIRRALIRYRNS